MDAAALRAAFPVLGRLTYLNAGTDGPVPAAAVVSAAAEIQREATEGRAFAHFARRGALAAEQRGRYAALVGAAPGDIALTTCTSEGLGHVVGGLGLGPGDEILTSDEEHPGLLGPLGAALRRGVTVRAAGLAQIAEAVRPETRLVACSHVGWVSGREAPAALAELNVPVLLDGAQGAGAVPVDVETLGCAAYAGSGQKWLCGPDGAGFLYVRPALRERLAVSGPGYINLEDPGAGLDAALLPDARRFDAPALSAEATAFALAALDVLERAGWEDLHARGRELATRLARALSERGWVLAPRGATTLVSWEVPDAPAARARLAEAGVVVRDLPGRPLLRASVGAWNDESDLERLLEALGRP